MVHCKLKRVVAWFAVAVPGVASLVEQINPAPALGIQLPIWKVECTPRDQQKTPEAICLHLTRRIVKGYCPASRTLALELLLRPWTTSPSPGHHPANRFILGISSKMQAG